MKILDPGNTPKRLKVFLLWGVLLFVVQYVLVNLLAPSLGTSGLLVAVGISLIFAGFAGYMTANALKNNTGDKRSSAIYGAVVPLFASLLGLFVTLILSGQFNYQLPLFPMLAGLIGGYLSQRRF